MKTERDYESEGFWARISGATNLPPLAHLLLALIRWGEFAMDLGFCTVVAAGAGFVEGFSTPRRYRSKTFETKNAVVKVERRGEMVVTPKKTTPTSLHAVMGKDGHIYVKLDDALPYLRGRA